MGRGTARRRSPSPTDARSAPRSTNGLRPARYLVTRDDRIVMASEMGVLPIRKDIVTKWRLQRQDAAGRSRRSRLIPDEEIKANLARSHPYQEWLENT
jgi:glutamate synthase (NADPH/NADH) large chain